MQSLHRAKAGARLRPCPRATQTRRPAHTTPLRGDRPVRQAARPGARGPPLADLHRLRARGRPRRCPRDSRPDGRRGGAGSRPPRPRGVGARRADHGPPRRRRAGGPETRPGRRLSWAPPPGRTPKSSPTILTHDLRGPGTARQREGPREGPRHGKRKTHEALQRSGFAPKGIGERTGAEVQALSSCPITDRGGPRSAILRARRGQRR